MPQFTYKAKTSPQSALSGRIDAPSRAAAIAQLQAMGYTLTSLEQADAAAAPAWSMRSLRRIHTADLALFWRQLASLLEAGLPLVKTLETVGQQTENPRLAGVVNDIRTAVEGSDSLSAALGRHPKVFGAVAVSIVAAGEASGRLAEVAEQLATKVEKEQDLAGKLRSALLYPSFLLLVGLAAIAVLVTFVVPRFAILFAEMNQQLPWTTRTMLAISGWAHDYWWAALIGLVAAVVLARRALRTAAGRRLLDGAKLNMPVLGRVVRKIEMARFAHTFGTLVGSGVNILPALDITARTMSNGLIAAEVSQVRDRIAKGSRVEAALRKGRYFPPALVNMVAVGEDSSALDRMLVKVASAFDRDSDRVVASLTRLLEALLIVFLGGIVAVIVAAILLPIFQASAFVG